MLHVAAARPSGGAWALGDLVSVSSSPYHHQLAGAQGAPSFSSIASRQHETFRVFGDLMDWLEDRGLTWEDAERTIRRACAVSGEGAHEDEIVRYFSEVHGVVAVDEWRVRQVATFVAFRRKLERLGARRFGASLPERTVTALVTIPEEELELIRPFIHRGTAAFETEGG